MVNPLRLIITMLRLPNTLASASKLELHRHFIDALNGEGVKAGDLGSVPLCIDLPGLVPMAVWIFHLTAPPGGRAWDELKIQLMVPGQGRQDRGSFEAPDQRFKVLVGHSGDPECFVLWDAYLHEEFAFSKNVQVKFGTVAEAQTKGIAEQERTLATGSERVIVSRTDMLHAALRKRVVTG